MDISRLRAMILVAECGSISAASKKLFITPVSLFQQVNQLERELGFKIFNRTHRGVSLTIPGEIFYQKTKKSLSSFESLISTCQKMEQRAKKEIRIGVYWPFNLNSYITAYGKLHPEVSFIQSTDVYAKDYPLFSSVSNQILDMLQLDYEPKHMTPDLAFLPFLHDKYHIVCALDHPIAAQTYVTLEDLCKYELSISQDISSPVPIQQKLESMGKTLHTDSSTNLDILNKCNAGHLYIMDGEYAKTMDQFRSIPIEPEWPFIHGIVYKKDAPSHVLDFISYIRKTVGETSVADMEVLLHLA